MKNPKAKMWFAFVMASVLIGLTLFLSAGTTNYWQAWVYLGVGAVSGVLLTLSVIRDPILLANRTKIGPTAEQRPIQKIIVLSAGFRPWLHSLFPAWTAVSHGQTCPHGSP